MSVPTSGQSQRHLCGFLDRCQLKSHPEVTKSSTETTFGNRCGAGNCYHFGMRHVKSHAKSLQCEPGAYLYTNVFPLTSILTISALEEFTPFLTRALFAIRHCVALTDNCAYVVMQNMAMHCIEMPFCGISIKPGKKKKIKAAEE
ncbi:hypothetical protein AB205_0019840 [Aquarana catesbeiana]|uniref:Uncharacterized protein n=1 Tax=Aquarana catesbeiana TaxID=8400 RepID=A0A2G9S201_AQUCT|nr:hypothetical protein AB205_0019840 [Aquarana catesbeiana]